MLRTRIRRALTSVATGSSRGGIAIIMLVGFIGLAVPIVTGAVVLTGTLSRASRVYDDRLERQYCNEGAVEHAIWRIKYEPGFAGSLTEEVPFNYSLNECGGTQLITITWYSETVPGVMGAVDYTVPAGHEIEIHLTVLDPSEEDMWVAYDTVDEPSWVKLPSPEHGDRTYRLHNNPTPPVGDTQYQHPLPTDLTMPTATTLYNYDEDSASYPPGRTIQKGDEPCTQTDQVKYQNWRTDPLVSGYHIDGTVEFDIWLALVGFQTDKTGVFNVCVRDKNGGSYTTIVDKTVTLDPENFDAGAFVSTNDPFETYDIEADWDGSTSRARITVTQDVVELVSIQIQ